jgi:hypothetical protein
MWQLGTLVLAPLVIALIAFLAIPGLMFAVPVAVAKKVRGERSTFVCAGADECFGACTADMRAHNARRAVHTVYRAHQSHASGNGYRCRRADVAHICLLCRALPFVSTRPLRQRLVRRRRQKRRRTGSTTALDTRYMEYAHV